MVKSTETFDAKIHDIECDEFFIQSLYQNKIYIFYNFPNGEHETIKGPSRIFNVGESGVYFSSSGKTKDWAQVKFHLQDKSYQYVGEYSSSIGEHRFDVIHFESVKHPPIVRPRISEENNYLQKQIENRLAQTPEDDESDGDFLKKEKVYENSSVVVYDSGPSNKQSELTNNVFLVIKSGSFPIDPKIPLDASRVYSIHSLDKERPKFRVDFAYKVTELEESDVLLDRIIVEPQNQTINGFKVEYGSITSFNLVLPKEAEYGNTTAHKQLEEFRKELRRFAVEVSLEQSEDVEEV